ncbi:MAG: enolase C-terminal domain-like protein, partial [Armatimonadota bacterium]
MDRRDFVGSLLAGGAAVALGGREASGARVEPPDKAATWRALSEHRLAKIEARRLRDRYPRRVGRNSKGRPVGGGGAYQVRTITTDQGVSGWAMSWVPDDRLGDIIGRPISELFDIEQGTLPPGDGLDLPLHDLAGNILGKPVYALLGSRGPTLVPVYSGAIYFDDMEPEDNPRGVAGVLASCQQDYDAGYRAFKLKIGRGFKWMPGEEGWQRDIDVTRAVRERFPDCKILVDANDAYTCDQFLKYLTAVADCDLFFIEEP